MGPTDCLRLFVLCLWLLDGDVNCENTQKGYVLHVQVAQAAMGVHNDDGDYKRWSEPPIFRIPKAGYKTSSVHRGQSGNTYPAQEDHTTNLKSSQIQSSYPYSVFPEAQHGNSPKSQVNHFKSGFNPAPVTRRRSTVVYNRSANKAFAFPGGKKIQQANSDSVLSTGAVQVPPRIYHARTKSTGGFSPVQVGRAAVGFGPNNRKSLIYSQASPNVQARLKSESYKIHVNPSGDPKKSGHFPGSNSAGKADTETSYPAFRPRAYSGDVMPEAKGYTHARRLKPGSDKTKPQASSTAGRKFLDTGFPSAKQNQGSYSHDSIKVGFGLGVPASSHNYNSRGRQPWHPPPPDRSQIPVQGKFKPFQRLPTHDDLPVPTHLSDNETAPTQTSAETTLPPSLNSTSITSSAVPSVDGELSTKADSSMQTEGQNAELVPQGSDPEGQSESSAEVGPSLEQRETFTVSPPELQAAEKDGEDDKVVSSPLETVQSAV